MHVSWRIWLSSALVAAPFPILVALHAKDAGGLDAIDRDFLARNVLHVLGALGLLVVAGRLLYSRLAAGPPTLSVAATALLCTGIAFGLAAPVDIAWSDGCNDFSGIAPILSAATFEAGLTQSPSAFVGMSTLVLCV